jgi:hypothetical protein
MPLPRRNALALLLAVCLAVLPGCAEMAPPTLPGTGAETFALPDWRDPEPAGTLSARALIGAPVIGAGRLLGRVSDLTVGPDDRVATAVVEGPAGRTALPWSALEVVDGTLRLAPGAGTAPGTDPARREAPAGWSVRAFVGEPVTLEDDEPYGIVEDLSLSADGALRAVVVRPEGRGASGDAQAFPFFGRRWGFDPQAGRYRLPYGAEALG